MGFKRRTPPGAPVHLDKVHLERNRRKPGGSRYVSAPLDERDLRPLEAGCVMLDIRSPLSEDDYRAVARLLEARPDVWLNPPGRSTDLAALRFFGHLERLILPRYEGDNVAELHHVPALTHLRLDSVRPRISLEPLAQLERLAWVQLDGHRHAEVLCSLPALRHAILVRTDLGAPFTGLPHATGAALVQCKADALPALPRVRRLRLSLCKIAAGLDGLAAMSRLEELRLTAMKEVSALPDLSGLGALRHLSLYKMLGLRDIAAVASMPALEGLEIKEVPLETRALACLRDHPTLRSVTLELGSRRETTRAKELLGLELAGVRRTAGGFSLIEDEPDHYTLTLSDVHTSWDVFEQAGLEPNGHTWSRLAESVMAQWPAPSRKRISLDSEADLFSARSRNLRAVSSLFEAMARLAERDDELIERLRKL